MTLVCQSCGRTWDRQAKRGPVPKRCAACVLSARRVAHRPVACADCATSFTPKRRDSMRCDSSVGSRLSTCPTCGAVFRHGRHAQTYCSLDCRPRDALGRARLAEREAAQVERAHQSMVAARLREDASLAAETARRRVCQRCGGPFRARHSRMVYCRPECRFATQRSGPFDLSCQHCAEPFTSPRLNARYCSYGCQRKARKRAPGEFARRRRQDVVRRLRPAVIARFGMRCYLCSRPITVPASEVTNPGALTLDHVVPIAMGGRDTVDNLRPTHRSCNEDKGERYPVWWERRAAGMAA